MKFEDIDKLAISTLRLLAIDQVSSAQSGHPGAPLGLAPTGHVLWRHMKFNPKNDAWINKDRFVLSNGHACALLYALLHLSGYDYSIDDLRQFRHLNSRTPGHPEANLPGIETTTGPLGQGIANSVGLAIAQANFAATYNKPNDKMTISDSYTYVFLGDGCLQEGVASEACSLAGHLKLGNLIVFYDDNKITIDGKTQFSFDEDVLKRFEAYGWETLIVENGDEDLDAISEALERAQNNKDHPTLIKVTTTIGFGSLKQGEEVVHGSPLKNDDVKQIKKKFGFDPDTSFVVPQEVYDFYKNNIIDPGIEANKKWDQLLETYLTKYPVEGEEIKRRLNKAFPLNWDHCLPTFKPDDSSMATRKLSELVLTKIVDELPEVIGGSADLTPSNLTKTKGSVDFQPPQSGIGDYSGRYIRYGIREHAMGAIMNGISAYGANFKPYGGTFLNFVSYGVGALRLAALSNEPVIWVATHDSIGLGEDGPTHQPIETLTHLRAIPNLHVWRPADGNETVAAYKCAIESKNTPSVIALSRQNLPQLEGSCNRKSLRGAYIIYDVKNPDIILTSTGSEVHLCIEAAKLLNKRKVPVKARIISQPDFYSFNQQPKEYQMSIYPDGIPVISVEAGATYIWGRYAHESIGINIFGCSGKGSDVYKYFDLVPEEIAKKADTVLESYKGKVVYSTINKVLPL